MATGLENFRWVLRDRLAGADLPGHSVPLADDLDFLASQGVRTLVTLTRRPLEPLVGRETPELLHFPVADMGVPNTRATLLLCRRLMAPGAEGAVAFHCRAGLGRTGTLLACCLLVLGEAAEGARVDSAETAIRRVRFVNAYYIQSQIQEDFIGHFEDFLRRCEADPGLLHEPESPKLPPLRLPWITG